MKRVFRTDFVPAEKLELVLTRRELYLMVKTSDIPPAQEVAPTRFFVSIAPGDKQLVLAWKGAHSSDYSWEELADLTGHSYDEIESYMRNAARLGFDTGYLYEADD